MEHTSYECNIQYSKTVPEWEVKLYLNFASDNYVTNYYQKIISYCKCKNVTYGLFCTFLFTDQLWYNFLGFIFINEKCFHYSKKNNYDYAETGAKEFLQRSFQKIGYTYCSLFIYLCLDFICC